MTAMKVMVLFNPVSGRGLSASAAQEVDVALTSSGHVAVCTPTRLEPTEAWLDQALREVELAVIVGGDGAMRMAGAAAARTGTPVYHFPCGTENLFAREFGMNRDPTLLLRAIEKFQTKRVDVGTVNGRAFLLMLSVGFDADVVHDLASTRGKSISHWTYFMPILRQFFEWKAPLLRIDVDGRCIVDHQPGFFVVGNSRQYGWRFDPAARAVMDDGVLDAVFFPARGRIELLAWSLRCRARRHLRHPRLKYVTGRQLTLTCDHPLRFQIDGDPPEDVPVKEPDGPSQVWRLEIGIRPAELAVLHPPDK